MDIEITHISPDCENGDKWHVTFAEYANTALLTRYLLETVTNPVVVTLILFMSLLRYEERLKTGIYQTPPSPPLTGHGNMGSSTLMTRDILRLMNFPDKYGFYDGVNDANA